MLVVLAACGGSDQTTEDLLLARPPTGYAPAGTDADGPMSIDTAAAASVADAELKRRLLRDQGYDAGHARIWVQGEAYITAVVYRLGDPEDADRLVAFEVDQAEAHVGAYTFSVPTVEDAVGYVLSGSRRDVGSTLFCHSVWFPRGRYVFNVNDCAARPGATATVTRLAEQQDVRARSLRS